MDLVNVDDYPKLLLYYLIRVLMSWSQTSWLNTSRVLAIPAAWEREPSRYLNTRTVERGMCGSCTLSI